jgi:hypothetical protein
MDTVIAEGGCLCGAVRYRIAGPARATSLCHCRTCRLAAGAPAVAWVVVNAAAFQILSGTPAVFYSSPAIRRTFCGRCGTSLTYQRESEPQTIDITTASLDAPAAFPPTREIWLSHKVPWEHSHEQMAQYPESSRPQRSTSDP